MQNNTAKNFSLQLGSLASLYLSLAFFLVLVFGMINLIFPDSLDSTWQIESSASMVRFGFAMTVVFFPTYLFLTRSVNQQRRESQDGKYLGLTKWLIYLSLLGGGAILLGDMVAIIMGFLEGELTTRFILKALAVLVVTGSAFFYYIKDAQGYWIKKKKQSVVCAYLAAAVILTTLATSLAYIETPTEVRARSADEQQIQDLRNIQWSIEDSLRENAQLPITLENLRDGRQIPEAPESRPAYSYTTTATGFELCATFAHQAREGNLYGRAYHGGEDSTPHITNPEDWYHEAGEWCFQREVKVPDQTQ